MRPARRSILVAARGGAGPPYLTSPRSTVVAVFAVAAFGALFAVPFAANRLLIVAGEPERAERWEGAMLVWGGGGARRSSSGLLVVPGGFSPGGSLADAAGLRPPRSRQGWSSPSSARLVAVELGS